MEELIVSVEIPNNSDEEKTAQLTSRLRNELTELPLESIRHVTGGEIPEGARAAKDAITWGALAVTLGTPVLGNLFKLLQSWISRQPTKAKVTVSIGKAKLAIEGDPSIEQERLIQEFLKTIAANPSARQTSAKKTAF